MATATELTVVEEFAQLRQVAETQKGWTVTPLQPDSFLLGIPRKDGGELWLRCEADQYPFPPYGDGADRMPAMLTHPNL